MRGLALSIVAVSIAVVGVWQNGCLNSDACLRHSDCDGEQLCIDGRCQDEGTAAAGGQGGAGMGGAGTGGQAGAG